MANHVSNEGTSAAAISTTEKSTLPPQPVLTTTETPSLPPQKVLSGGALWLIYLLSSYGPLSMNLYVPSLPALQADLHTTAMHAVLTVSVYTLTFGGMQLVLGPLSDVHGRRIILLNSLSLYSAGSLVGAMAFDIWTLLVMRVVQALGAAGVMVCTQAVLRDLYAQKEREKLMSVIAMVRSTAPIFGPVLGSALGSSPLGWRASFLALALVGAGSIVGVYHLLPESLATAKRQPKFVPSAVLKTNWRVLRSREFLCWSVPDAVGFGGIFTYVTTSAFILQDFFGVPLSLYGFCFALTTSGGVIGSFLGPRIRSRFLLRPSTTFLVGSSISSVSSSGLVLLAVLGVFSEPTTLGLVLLQAFTFCGSVGRNISQLQSQVQALEPFAGRAGAAAGMMGCVRMLSATLVSATAGALHNDETDSPNSLCFTIFFLFSSSHVLHLLLRPRHVKVSAGRAVVQPSFDRKEDLPVAEAGDAQLRPDGGADGAAEGEAEDSWQELRAVHAAVAMEQASPSNLTKLPSTNSRLPAGSTAELGVEHAL